jgi:hypothetical protein
MTAFEPAAWYADRSLFALLLMRRRGEPRGLRFGSDRTLLANTRRKGPERVCYDRSSPGSR